MGGVIFMSSLYFMLQSILNIFAFEYSFGEKKLIIFMDGGSPPSFGENFAKIINFFPLPLLTLASSRVLKHGAEIK